MAHRPINTRDPLVDPKDRRARGVLQAVQTGQADTLQPEFTCVSCGAQVYFQREPGPCPACGKPRPVIEGTSHVS